MSSKEQLEAALGRVADLLDRAKLGWVVGGSAGLLLRGLPLEAEPRDLDLYVDASFAQEAHEALQTHAVDTPVWSVSSLYRSRLSHYKVEGIPVELVGGFEVQRDGCVYAVEVEAALKPLGTRYVLPGNCECTLAPLAHELWFNLLRQRDDRCLQVAKAIQAAPHVHLAPVRMLVTRNPLLAPLEQQALDWLAQAQAQAQAQTQAQKQKQKQKQKQLQALKQPQPQPQKQPQLQDEGGKEMKPS